MATNRKFAVPSYRLHKASGQAVVTLDGQDHYLGRHGTDESRARYERLIALYLANGRHLPVQDSGGDYSVAQLCDEFLDHAESEYRRPDGTQSKEVQNVKIALRPLLELYADLPAADFGPRALVAYRQRLLETTTLRRKTINQRVGIVRRAFKWATREERVPPSIYHGLGTVDGLRRGRCGAKDNPPVQCVPAEDIEAVLPYLPPPVRAMVQLQLVTGARPGEIVCMRPCEIDMSGKVWEYGPPNHKNAWRGAERMIAIGPKGQAIVREFLRPGFQEKPLFSPKEAERIRRERIKATRKTPLWPSSLKRERARDGRVARRAPRDAYDVTTYARAIARACKKAGVPKWTPGRLRHNAATQVDKEHGLLAAQAMLGHTQVETTQIYSDAQRARALEIAEEVG